MRSTRSGRIAACTALAVAAGMLLSGPVSAAEQPVPTAKAERPETDDRATGTRPQAPAPKAKNSTRGTTAAAPLTPLFDVDGDGWSDILYRGLSGRTFLKTFHDEQDPVYGVPGSGPDDGADFKDVIPAGDLDRDGRPELLTLSVTGRLSLLTAETNGSSATGWSGSGWNVYNKVTGVGDVTGDGKADLLARTYAGSLYLYPGKGTAGSSSPYGSRIALGGGWNSYSQIVGGGDFTADGKADLAVATPGGSLYVYPGNGSGGFGDRIKSGTGWNMYNQIQVLTNNTGGSWLVGRDASGKMWNYPSNGAGGFGDRVAMGQGWEFTDLISGQGGVPAHGRSELVGRTSGGAVYYYYGKQNGGFGDRQEALGNGQAPVDQVGMAVASSFDSQNETSWLFWGGGKLYIGDHDLGAGWGIYNSLVGVGDINGDGYGDLLARDKSNVLWLYPSYGNGYQFRDRVRLGSGWGSYNKLFGAGDITGDGRADLLARGSDGTLWAYPGNGTAGFGDRVKIGDGGWNTLKKLAAVGDITGDGRTDLVGVNSAGTAYLYKATGLKGLSTFKGSTSLGGGWNAYVNLL
ncbi:VCBS repeat-containing protein [Streptomyces sp. AP-93]|uniref:FG-GAP repeat domain-containing protein n=1 Tax=Streptomyces sp. AP-93 TaxID=2929048 RepID=UPI001FAEFC0A|nr:VCBS repeat-containing protein [Streptomyces sp. AP-93]MCJ0871018.1 VCBS repeat-containing protein [Streptomyces sp. AP-93]